MKQFENTSIPKNHPQFETHLKLHLTNPFSTWQPPLSTRQPQQTTTTSIQRKSSFSKTHTPFRETISRNQLENHHPYHCRQQREHHETHSKIAFPRETIHDTKRETTCKFTHEPSIHNSQQESQHPFSTSQPPVSTR